VFTEVDPMATGFPYPREVEESMRALYLSLRENDRRRYAAVEAAKLGHGGTEYVSGVLGCDPKTIRHGADDLGELVRQLPDTAPDDRVRKKGAAESRS
jgi:hypothetical protein